MGATTVGRRSQRGMERSFRFGRPEACRAGSAERGLGLRWSGQPKDASRHARSVDRRSVGCASSPVVRSATCVPRDTSRSPTGVKRRTAPSCVVTISPHVAGLPAVDRARGRCYRLAAAADQTTGGRGANPHLRCGLSRLRRETGDGEAQGRRGPRRLRATARRGGRRILRTPGSRAGTALHRPRADLRRGRALAVVPREEAPVLHPGAVPVHPRDPADEGGRGRPRTVDRGVVPVREPALDAGHGVARRLLRALGLAGGGDHDQPVRRRRDHEARGAHDAVGVADGRELHRAGHRVPLHDAAQAATERGTEHRHPGDDDDRDPVHPRDARSRSSSCRRGGSTGSTGTRPPSSSRSSGACGARSSTWRPSTCRAGGSSWPGWPRSSSRSTSSTACCRRSTRTPRPRSGGRG